MSKRRTTPAMEFAATRKTLPEIEEAKDLDDILLCDYVICVLAIPPMAILYHDNVIDFCCKCDRKVQLRPYVPKGPPRICYDCATKLKDQPLTIITAPASSLADDFRRWLKSKK